MSIAYHFYFVQVNVRSKEVSAMKTKIDSAVRVTLVLSEEEAKWLKDYMQNSHYNSESKQDTAMRAAFFEALTHDFDE